MTPINLMTPIDLNAILSSEWSLTVEPCPPGCNIPSGKWLTTLNYIGDDESREPWKVREESP